MEELKLRRDKINTDVRLKADTIIDRIHDRKRYLGYNDNDLMWINRSLNRDIVIQHKLYEYPELYKYHSFSEDDIRAFIKEEFSDVAKYLEDNYYICDRYLDVIKSIIENQKVSMEFIKDYIGIMYTTIYKDKYDASDDKNFQLIKSIVEYQNVDEEFIRKVTEYYFDNYEEFEYHQSKKYYEEELAFAITHNRYKVKLSEEFVMKYPELIFIVFPYCSISLSHLSTDVLDDLWDKYADGWAEVYADCNEDEAAFRPFGFDYIMDAVKRRKSCVHYLYRESDRTDCVDMFLTNLFADKLPDEFRRKLEQNFDKFVKKLSPRKGIECLFYYIQNQKLTPGMYEKIKAYVKENDIKLYHEYSNTNYFYYISPYVIANNKYLDMEFVMKYIDDIDLNSLLSKYKLSCKFDGFEIPVHLRGKLDWTDNMESLFDFLISYKKSIDIAGVYGATGGDTTTIDAGKEGYNILKRILIDLVKYNKFNNESFKRLDNLAKDHLVNTRDYCDFAITALVYQDIGEDSLKLIDNLSSLIEKISRDKERKML